MFRQLLRRLRARPAELAESVAVLQLKVQRQNKRIQAMSQDLAELKVQIERVNNTAQQAKQRATSALSTAEGALDGLSDLEDLTRL